MLRQTSPLLFSAQLKFSKIMQQEEIWKDVPGYEGLYQASNLGRIKSDIKIKNQT